MPPIASIDDKDAIVKEMAPLVKRIAYHFMTRLPASVDVDDLIQAGLIGLLDASDNFDSTQGAQFETYAVQRIRGSMLDELRHADWLPRNVRKNLRKIEAAVAKLEQKFGRQPNETELAGRQRFLRLLPGRQPVQPADDHRGQGLSPDARQRDQQPP